MTWGAIFRSAYAAANERSRLAARAVIERIALPAGQTPVEPVAAPETVAGTVHRQAVHALARADALLAPLRLTSPAPALQAVQAEYPGNAHSHESHADASPGQVTK